MVKIRMNEEKRILLLGRTGLLAQAMALVAHIANKETQCRVLVLGKLLLHFVLFQLVAAKHHQAFDLRAVVKHRLYKCFAKGAGTSSN